MMTLLAVLFAAAPTVDVLLFGAHDHMAITGGYDWGASGPGTGASAATHHCELSVSPVGSISMPSLAVPTVLLGEIGEHPIRLADYTPRVPLGPPRTA